jgi:hypothetical protein
MGTAIGLAIGEALPRGEVGPQVAVYRQGEPPIVRAISSDVLS